MVYRKREDRVARNASQLISLLVRYPEVGTVKYDPREQTLRLGLLVMGELAEPDWEATRSALLKTLEVYLWMLQRPADVVEVERETYGELTAVSITRDAASLSPEEIYTVIEFFRERFAGRLVLEVVEYPAEEDWMAQDEAIEDMMAELEASRSGRNLIAIREDGRVVVYQK